MRQNIQFKKSFLIALVASLCLSALIGIYVFLLGDFRQMELRVLLTTLSIGIYSLTGLCSSVLYEIKKGHPVAIAGIGFSIVSFVLTIIAIWEITNGDNWQLLLGCIIFAFSFAHASLLLLLRKNKPSLEMVRNASLSAIGIVCIMLITIVIEEDMTEEFYIRLLGVFAILDVLGTIVTPILFKICALDVKK